MAGPPGIQVRELGQGVWALGDPRMVGGEEAAQGRPGRAPQRTQARRQAVGAVEVRVARFLGTWVAGRRGLPPRRPSRQTAPLRGGDSFILDGHRRWCRNSSCLHKGHVCLTSMRLLTQKGRKQQPRKHPDTKRPAHSSQVRRPGTGEVWVMT